MKVYITSYAVPEDGSRECEGFGIYGTYKEARASIALDIYLKRGEYRSIEGGWFVEPYTPPLAKDACTKTGLGQFIYAVVLPGVGRTALRSLNALAGWPVAAYSRGIDSYEEEEEDE
jgi:hypothetical protein|tara:strand:+ start:9385 stop:9735 length:351 start_codon:yes stop_codon:yes gene_type:complete